MEVRAVSESTVKGWYKVTMDSGEHKAKRRALEESFETQFEQHGSPEGAALFGRRDQKVATWEYYFTPEAMAFAEDIIKEFAWGKEYAWGQACSGPSATVKNLSLCGGRPGNKYERLVQSSSKDI
jgi:hypothetical protein